MVHGCSPNKGTPKAPDLSARFTRCAKPEIRDPSVKDLKVGANKGGSQRKVPLKAHLGRFGRAKRTILSLCFSFFVFLSLSLSVFCFSLCFFAISLFCRFVSLFLYFIFVVLSFVFFVSPSLLIF